MQDLLRQDESFRARLREHMRGRVSEFIQEVRNYAGEIASAIKDHDDGCVGVALVIDSTEKLAAPGSGQEQMHSAVRNLFVQNGDNLALPEIHTIYLVPPWLPISDGGALRMALCQFPAVRIEKLGPGAEPDELGLKLMDDVLCARMPEVEELIAADDLRRLYLMSGGIQRVLFQLLHGVARRSRAAATCRSRARSWSRRSTRSARSTSRSRSRRLHRSGEKQPGCAARRERSCRDPCHGDTARRRRAGAPRRRPA